MEKVTSPVIEPTSDGVQEISSPAKDDGLSRIPIEQYEYINGFKLASVIVSVTLLAIPNHARYIHNRHSHSQDHNRI